MTRTHNEALEALKIGEIDYAWELAQMDEGLSEDVTREQWIAFAYRALANRVEAEAVEQF